MNARKRTCIHILIVAYKPLGVIQLNMATASLEIRNQKKSKNLKTYHGYLKCLASLLYGCEFIILIPDHS